MSSSPTCPRCGAPLSADLPAGRPCPRCLLAAGVAAASTAGPGVRGSLEGMEPPPPESIAALFPSLEVHEVLGQGGMGVVYRAVQKDLGREVALKVLWAPSGDAAALEERFLREAHAMARLSHPNIVAVHDFGRAGEHLYLVLERVDGTSLRQVLRAGGLQPAQALSIVAEICAALQYAHDRGVVHRDIKPENVLLDRAGHVKVADFGLAKLLSSPAGAERLTRATQAMGTPQYMAPEQLERPLAVDHRADIYSLGVVFYELLTGELPLGRFAPPSRKVEIDVRLDGVVLRTLEKEPELRYQRAAEVRTEVEGIVNGTAPATRSPGARRHISARTILLVLLVLLLLLPLACFALLTVSPGGVQRVPPAPETSGEPAGR